MENIPNCPKCGSEYTYEDGELYICPECAYEWSKEAAVEEEAEAELIIRDANGNILEEGDSVTVIKTLRSKEAAMGSRLVPRSRVSDLLKVMTVTTLTVKYPV